MSPSPLSVVETDLRAGRTVLIDGATGTELERRGAAMHDDAWCAMATITHPEILLDVHRDYIRAGARVIITNTFSTNRSMLGPAGLGDRVAEINLRAVEIALEARARTHTENSVVVAGSMSHQSPFVYLDDGRVLRTPPPIDIARENFREMASLLAGAGVDMIMLEMQSDPALAAEAIAAARATGLPMWVGLSVDRSETGAIVSHNDHELLAGEMFRAIVPEDAMVTGIMHSNPNVTGDALDLLRSQWRRPTMAFPDSGYFEPPHWRFVDVISPAVLANLTLEWVDAGTQVVGGCCGLGLEHIEAIATALARR